MRFPHSYECHETRGHWTKPSNKQNLLKTSCNIYVEGNISKIYFNISFNINTSFTKNVVLNFNGLKSFLPKNVYKCVALFKIAM